MEISIAFRHMDATEAIKAHVNEKTERLEKFVSGDTVANWVLFVDAGQHVADLHIKGPHIDYFAQAKSESMYLSIEDAVDKIEKQLKKHKEILKDHLHRN